MKSAKLRKSARHQQCTFQIPGVCNHNPETTVLCHLQFDGGIMGGKENDLSAAYGCSDCHWTIDNRLVSDAERWFHMGRALARTHKKMHQDGVLSVV